MAASRPPTRRTSFTSPVVDYEPPPQGTPAARACPSPFSAALRRPALRTLRPVPTAATGPRREPPPPRAAAVFADAALRRALEVIDRRRPVAQLRPLLTPSLFDAVATLVGAAPEGTAVLRRMRLRAVDAADGEARAAEVFATYSRGRRVRAIAGRVELVDGRWTVTALQIG